MRPDGSAECRGEPQACPYIATMARIEQVLDAHAAALQRHTGALAENTAALTEMRVDMARIETVAAERQRSAEATGGMARWLINLVVTLLGMAAGWLLGRMGSKH